MLGQRRRRWTNIYPSLGECLVFAGDQHVFSDRDSNLVTGSFALALKFFKETKCFVLAAHS